MLGLGTACIVPVAADGQGRMLPDALRERSPALDGPTIVCAQAGNVNTGAFDPLEEIADAAEAAGAWLHVDGAFGLWAAASPALRAPRRRRRAGRLVGDRRAQVAQRPLRLRHRVLRAPRRAPRRDERARELPVHAEPGGPRDQIDWNPEFSRRARGFPVYAAIRSLGRAAIAELVERCCRARAALRRGARRAPGVEVLNDVVLNQVLVRFGDDGRRRRDTRR